MPKARRCWRRKKNPERIMPRKDRRKRHQMVYFRKFLILEKLMNTKYKNINSFSISFYEMLKNLKFGEKLRKKKGEN
jgi:hypothetical protein